MRHLGSEPWLCVEAPDVVPGAAPEPCWRSYSSCRRAAPPQRTSPRSRRPGFHQRQTQRQPNRPAFRPAFRPARPRAGPCPHRGRATVRSSAPRRRAGSEKQVLPLQPNGFGEIRPTPPELDRRRFTLPDRLAPLPGAGFASRVTTPAPASVIARSTWKRGCPVSAADLSWVRLAFFGFDGARHTGELLVNRTVADDLVAGVPPALRRPVPDRGDADHPGRRARRSADRRRQQHRGLQLPADDRRDVVLPARVRARDRRGPVPEPLHEGRRGAARAGVVVPPTRAGASRDDRARRAGRAGLRCDRLDVGRHLAIAQGPPTLLPERH